MNKTINYQQDNFIVIGAGETGHSIVEFLQFKGAKILNVLDTRINPPVMGGFKVVSGPLDYELLKVADVIVISPGVSIYEPALITALENNKQVVGDIELFAREIKTWGSRVIGVTGSNGKTTVSSLVGQLAKSAQINVMIAGNIGTPVLSALVNLITSNAKKPELIVLELSSFQLEACLSLELDAATVLNISEDHMDRYQDLLHYAYVKSQIFKHAKAQVLNFDDYLVRAMARTNQTKYYFGLNLCEYSINSTVDGTYLNINGDNYVDCSELALIGTHNYLNALASLALLKAAGYSLAQFKNMLVKFSGLEHRMQKVIEHKGVLYIEDSKGTNVGAVLAGVSGINKPIHLILGGDGKGQDFNPLRELVFQKCKSVALIGQDAKEIAQVLDGFKDLMIYTSLEEAVKNLIKKAKTGDAVVLSPACASWDMFENYKERAQTFINAIYANLD